MKKAVRVVVQDVRGWVLLCTPGASKASRPGRPDREIPGGKVDAEDASPAAAAQREVHEETGLYIPLEQFEDLGLANFDTKAEGAWEIRLFRVRLNEQVDSLEAENPEEIAALDFYQPEASDVNRAIAVYGFDTLQALLERAA